jgi:23S rRNA (guanosine2251-2'-O)-methyltransferase
MTRALGEAGDEVPFRASVTAAPYDALQTVPVVLVLDNVRSLYNVGAFFRTADNAGVQALVLAGITPRPPHRGLSKTALGAEHTVRWEHSADALEAIRSWRAAGYQIAAMETARHAVDLFGWQPAFPVCVVFGHEVEGISPGVLDACDLCVRVPTLGAKHSLNVATAGGVVCYELLRKYRALITPASALSTAGTQYR